MLILSAIGYRAGRVRGIFSLPDRLRPLCPALLAYVELFTPFDDLAPSPHRMHATSQAWADGRRRSLIVPVTSLVMSCHLAPSFGKLHDHVELGPHADVHNSGRHYFLNHYYNYFFFLFTRYWRRLG